MLTSASESHERDENFWLGWLAASINIYLRDGTDKRDLEDSLRAFLRSPVATPALCQILTKS